MLQLPWQEAASSLLPSGLRVLHCEGVRNVQSLHETEEQAALREKVSWKGIYYFLSKYRLRFFFVFYKGTWTPTYVYNWK